jgi:hypothetical protein
MSVTNRRLLRPIPAIGYLALALTAAPVLHGQDGVRALFNQVRTPNPTVAAQDIPIVSAGATDGERALMGHVGVGPTLQAELLASDTVGYQIDGAQALMGRPATTQARRSIVAKKQ